jgi:hypothetical protein
MGNDFHEPRPDCKRCAVRWEQNAHPEPRGDRPAHGERSRTLERLTAHAPAKGSQSVKPSCHAVCEPQIESCAIAPVNRWRCCKFVCDLDTVFQGRHGRWRFLRRLIWKQSFSSLVDVGDRHLTRAERDALLPNEILPYVSLAGAPVPGDGND